MAQMVGLNHIVLNFLHIISHNVHVGILLTVNGSLLQPHKHLGKLHGHRGSSQRIPVFNMILICHNADLLSRQIRYGVNRLVRGELTESRVRVSEHLDAALIIILVEHIHKIAVQHGAHLFYRVKNIGQIKDSILRNKIHQIRCHSGSDINGPADYGLCKFRRVPQLSARIYVHSDLSSAPLV